MRVRSAVLWLLLALVATGAHACSCVLKGNGCGAAQLTGTLFRGEVLAERTIQVPFNVPGEPKEFTDSRVFRIRVLESFSGAQRVDDEVEVLTGAGGGDCGYDFVVGRRYLVDAYSVRADPDSAAQHGVTLGVGICGRTREEAMAAIVLRELRTSLAGSRQPDLHGSVRYLEGRYASPGEPIPSLQVRLTAHSDGAVYLARTDDDGVYTFATLPADDYTAAIDLPPHRQLMRYADSEPLRITVPTNDGTGLDCHLNALVGSTGGVRVTVVDAAGKPQPGVIMISTAGEKPETSRFGNEDSDNGSFTLGQLSDGDYMLTFINYLTHMRGEGMAKVRDGAISDTSDILATPFTPPPDEE